MSPIAFLVKAIRFGGIKRNYKEHKNINSRDINWLIDTTEELLESHQKQVDQEVKLLEELSDLKQQMGKGDEF